MARSKSAFENLTARNGFLTAQLGSGWSAPFTGFSWRAFQAFVALVDAWYSSDITSKPHIEAAMRATLLTLQPSEMKAARITIYGVGNEEAMMELWPMIAPGESKYHVPAVCGICGKPATREMITTVDELPLMRCDEHYKSVVCVMATKSIPTTP